MTPILVVLYALAGLVIVAEGFIALAGACALGQVHLRRDSEFKVLMTADGPPIGQPLPALGAAGLSGASVRSSERTGRRRVVLLLETDCNPCHRVLQEAPATVRDWSEPVQVLAVLEGPRAEAQRLLERYGWRLASILDETGEIRRRLGVERTPFGILVDRDGIVRMKGVVNHRKHLEGLLRGRGKRMRGLAWEQKATSHGPVSAG